MGISHVKPVEPAVPLPVGAVRDPLAIPAEVKASIKILLVDDDRSLKWTRHAVLAEYYPNMDFSHGICPSCLGRLYPEAIATCPARRQPPM